MSISLSAKTIEKKILENFIEYQNLFIEFQSNFLSKLYKRHQGVENGVLALYFAKDMHQNILRQKDYNLNFNISFEKFWENLELSFPIKKSIIKIAENVSLPKETARRKISQLIKQKVLSKKNKIIGWLPNEQYKESYNLAVQKEIEGLSSLLIFICKKINLSISTDNTEKQVKEKFNFYWFHFLGVQLEYTKLWSSQLKDLELVLITLQVASIFAKKAKEKNFSHTNIYSNLNLIKDFESASINATSVSEVTGIPRATCIRKLENLVELKMIAKNNISKRYHLVPSSLSQGLIPKQTAQKVIKIFSEFYFICIRALDLKI